MERCYTSRLMIETVSDFTRFCSDNSEGQLVVHVVPIGDSTVHHPVVTRPCLVFIRNLSTKRTYYYSFCHSDSRPKVSDAEFAKTISQMPNIKWALDKKACMQLLNISNLYDANLCGFLRKNNILDAADYETPAHTLIRRNSTSPLQINQSIPLLKHKESFDMMADDIQKMVRGWDMKDDSFLRINQVILETLGKLETAGLFVDKELFEKRFHKPDSDLVHTRYNIYTSTGRPSNSFRNVNYAGLHNTDGTRKCFVSRFGDDGKLVLIDYAAFFPRIICKLVNYDIPSTTDVYEYLARLYFRKKDVDETDAKNAKAITFRQLFGGVEDEYAHIKYLASLKTYIAVNWAFFEKNGFAETPFFKRKITEHHIQDANPTKLFNYILQAAEGEIAIPRVQDVQRYLEGYQTKAILYTYDSILFDFYKDDGMKVLEAIRNLMNLDGSYSMKTYIGKSYHEMRQVDL